jgi:hypothetical protein
MALTELLMIAAYTASAVMIPLMAIQADRDNRSK